MFIDTMKLRFTQRATLKRDHMGRRHDHANTWNEVNFYVDHNDTALAELLWKNLIGIVFVRSAGSNDERIAMGELAAHWRSLGRDIPMFGVDAEEMEHVNNWTPDVKVDLLSEEFDLGQIDADDEDFNVDDNYQYPWRDAFFDETDVAY